MVYWRVNPANLMGAADSSSPSRNDAGPPNRRNRSFPGNAALLLALSIFARPTSAQAQSLVQDIFGRDLTQRGVTLVQWDGYLANPLIKTYFFPPTNSILPTTATLTANGARLYFESPSAVAASGPSKTITFTNRTIGVPVDISIFPSHQGRDQTYRLTLVFTDAANAKQTNTVPINVRILDRGHTNEFKVTINYDRDVTGFFADPDRQALVKQAAADWSYYFSSMDLDPVQIGSETTFIWSNRFAGGYFFANTNDYTGYLLYAYGTTNETHRSGGEGSHEGPVQRRSGTPLTIKRSGGFEAEINGNFNTLGWLVITNDDDWFLTQNLGNETNDLYSIAHHEIGHALIFNDAHPGFAAVRAAGAFTSEAVTNYYRAAIPVDAFDHLNGVIDPESGQGAFGYEYFGRIPRRRWLITKLDLLCAREVGYELRNSPLWTPLTAPSLDPFPAFAFVPLTLTLPVYGGIPIYCWEVIAGTLPPGLTLDPFTGALEGTPTIVGLYSFTVRVRDYHVGSPGLTRAITVLVMESPSPTLALSLLGMGPDALVDLLVTGAAGQRQVVEISDDLAKWIPVATNSLGAIPYHFFETNANPANARYYRARIVAERDP